MGRRPELKMLRCAANDLVRTAQVFGFRASAYSLSPLASLPQPKLAVQIAA